MKICIGTAQFMPGYGISNAHYRLNIIQKRNIIEKCKKLNIKTIDTAPYYGDSETTLGQIGVSDFDIVSKIPSLRQIPKPYFVYNQVCQSIRNLKIRKLKSLLFYDSQDFLKLSKTGEIAALKKDGLCEEIGVSVYHPEELEEMETEHWPEVVQLPLNIFDQRFALSGWLEKLKSRSTTIFARSIFFQGLCLLNSNQIPEFAKPHIYLWDKYGLNQKSLDERLSTCIEFVINNKFVDFMICGVINHFQLQKIFNLVYRPRIPIGSENQWITDVKFLDPRLWITKKL